MTLTSCHNTYNSDAKGTAGLHHGNTKPAAQPHPQPDLTMLSIAIGCLTTNQFDNNNTLKQKSPSNDELNQHERGDRFINDQLQQIVFFYEEMDRGNISTHYSCIAGLGWLSAALNRNQSFRNKDFKNCQEGLEIVTCIDSNELPMPINLRVQILSI